MNGSLRMVLRSALLVALISLPLGLATPHGASAAPHTIRLMNGAGMEVMAFRVEVFAGNIALFATFDEEGEIDLIHAGLRSPGAGVGVTLEGQLYLIRGDGTWSRYTYEWVKGGTPIPSEADNGTWTFGAPGAVASFAPSVTRELFGN